ncbi:MAG TPA: DUF1003 domain-containing protein [Pyrinomonadaceae bacterium]|jgi:uncharacterized membrane protein|nr:DUF1003 domain-containing protein [Pyrinomonadaceae bacterium]
MDTRKATSRKAAKVSTERLEEELQNNVEKIIAIEQEHKDNQTRGEKLSEVIARFCGSMTFVYIHIVWFGGWVLLNSLTSFAFDPFPFTFLTLVVSLEAIFLSTFILISQNNETKLTERRNHLDLQINILAEQENTRMLELVRLIARKVGVEHDDPKTEALLEHVEPVKIVEQIVTAKDEDNNNKSDTDSE